MWCVCFGLVYVVFVVRCWQFVVDCCLLFRVRCVLLVDCYLLFIVCCVQCVVAGLLIVWCLLLIVCG